VPYLPSLRDDAVLSDVFRRFSDHAAPLTDYAQRLMRGPSPLSVAQRELIGAYVSGLNACVYCHGVHTAIAVSQGIEEQLFAGWSTISSLRRSRTGCALCWAWCAH